MHEEKSKVDKDRRERRESGCNRLEHIIKAYKWEQNKINDNKISENKNRLM